MSSYDDLNYYDPTPAYQDIWPLILSIIKHIILRILYIIYFTTLFTLKSPRLVAALLEDLISLSVYIWKHWKALIKLFFIYLIYAPSTFFRFFFFSAIPFLVKYLNLPFYIFFSFIFKILLFFLLIFSPFLYFFFYFWYGGWYSLPLFDDSFILSKYYLLYFEVLVFSHFFFIFYSYYLEYSFFLAFFFRIKILLCLFLFFFLLYWFSFTL